MTWVPRDAEIGSGSDERRGLERRVEMLERDLRKVESQTIEIRAILNGLVSTMESRHKAFERGQDMILKTLDHVEKSQLSFEGELKMMAAAPQDLSKIMFTPGVVIAIIMTIASIIAGQQASTWGIKSDVRDIITHQAMQADLDKSENKLREERAATLKSTVDDTTKGMKLLQLEVQSLRETVLGQRRK